MITKNSATADAQTTIQELKKLVESFVVDREWQDFHNPKNLAMNISIEAAELMELLLWESTSEITHVVEQKRELIQKELADIFIAIVAFANSCDIDIASTVIKKIDEIEKRYPVEIVKGKHNAKELVGHKKNTQQ